MPPGSSKLRTYHDQAIGRVGESWGLVEGFRYVVQTEEEGMMLKLPFIHAFQWLGRKDSPKFSFDLCIDAREGREWQLLEAVKMIEKAHEDVGESDKVTVLIVMLGNPGNGHC
jgi:L-rhamnono-1,4-lactonase